MSRRIELERSVTHLVSTFNITPITAGHLRWAAPNGLFDAVVFDLDVQGRYGPNPDHLLGRVDDIGTTVVSRREIRDQLFIQLKGRTLNVALRGHTAMSAWVPAGGSKVKLSRYQSPPRFYRPAGSSIGEVVEEFRSGGRCSRGSSSITFSDRPLLDVFGGDFVFWVEGADAFAVERNTGILVEPRPQGRGTRYIAVVVKTRLAMRVLPLGYTHREIERFVSNSLSRSEGTPLLFAETDHGGVVGKFELPDNGQQMLADLRLSEGALIESVGQVPLDLRQIDQAVGGLQTFYTPPVPNTLGFSVFGQPSRILLRGVTGDLVADARSVEIPARADVELRKISSLSTTRVPFVLPAPGDPEGRISDFSGVGAVVVNGYAVTTRGRDIWGSLEHFAAIGALAAAVVAFWELSLILRGRGIDAQSGAPARKHRIPIASRRKRRGR